MKSSARIHTTRRAILQSAVAAAAAARAATAHWKPKLGIYSRYSPANIAKLLDISEAHVQRCCFSARIRLCQLLASQARNEAA